MERFKDLNERKVYGNYDVHIMHHYTTLAGLSGILHKGYIEARESKGDHDWGELIQSKEVVSFLDSRYDNELENLVWANNNNNTLNGRTQHLALHMDKIAVLIETNLDEMDEPVELLTTMVRSANKVSKGWNESFDKAEKDLEYANGILTELFPKEVVEKEVWTDEEIKEWEAKVEACKWCREGFKKNSYTYQMGDVEWLTSWDMFKTDYDHIETDENGQRIYKRTWHWHPWEGYNSIKEDCEALLNGGVKRLTEEEQAELQKYVDESDVRGVFNFLRKRGVPLEFFKDSSRYCYNNKHNPWEMIDGLKGLADSIRNILVNTDWIDVELRVPQNIKLTQDNCRIHIFSGIDLKATDRERIQKIVDYNNKKKQPLDIRIVNANEEPQLLSKE